MESLETTMHVVHGDGIVSVSMPISVGGVAALSRKDPIAWRSYLHWIHVLIDEYDKWVAEAEADA